MTTYNIHGIKGFCGEIVDIKVWNNGTSFKCNKIKEFKKSVVVYKVFADPEKKISLLCGHCSLAKG